jgi:hypothetical protein
VLVLLMLVGLVGLQALTGMEQTNKQLERSGKFHEDISQPLQSVSRLLVNCTPNIFLVWCF